MAETSEERARRSSCRRSAARETTCAECGIGAGDRPALLPQLRRRARRAPARLREAPASRRRSQPARLRRARRSRPASAAAQWSPIMAIGAIAVLGVMLLLGVLIGKDDNETTVGGRADDDDDGDAPPTTADDSRSHAGQGQEGADAAAPARSSRAARARPRGSRPTNPLEGLTGKALSDAAEGAPTRSRPAASPRSVDPGPAGGGSKGVTIGGD